MKHRFKKALFAFFKDEILNATDYGKPFETIQHVVSEVKFTELRSQIRLPQGINYNDTQSTYERSLASCKHELFNEAMKHIKVDTESLMGRQQFRERVIEVSLLVGHNK
jgi:glucose-6-phosphate-specific signal transduction histidine kinase